MTYRSPRFTLDTSAGQSARGVTRGAHTSCFVEYSTTAVGGSSNSHGTYGCWAPWPSSSCPEAASTSRSQQVSAMGVASLADVPPLLCCQTSVTK